MPSLLRFENRKTLPLIGLIILIAIGAVLYLAFKPSNKPTSIDTAKYVSLQQGYLFSIPAKHTANGTAIPGFTLIYSEGSPPQKGQSLDDLYANGTVAVQPIVELKDNNPEAFMAYVKDVLAADLRKIFKSPSDMRPAKQKGVDAIEVSALGEAGKVLRIDYAINFTQPVLVVAQDRSDAFKTVGLTMEDLKKSSFKTDIDRAAEVAKDLSEKIQQQDSAKLRANATPDFKKQMTKEQLADTLKKSGNYLQRPINIVGGLYQDKFFIAQLIFEVKVTGQQPAAGIVSLQKIGKTWKLDGLQLPQ